MGIETIEGSDKRWYGNVFTIMFLFYCSLGCLDGMWYFIYNNHWWPTYLIGLLGWFLIGLSWSDLFNGHFYSRDFLYPFDEKIVYANGVFFRRGDQAFILRKKFYSWDQDPEKFEKLPIRVYYNIFGKAIDRKINIHLSQVQQVR